MHIFSENAPHLCGVNRGHKKLCVHYETFILKKNFSEDEMKKVLAIMAVAVVVSTMAFGQEEEEEKVAPAKKPGIFSLGVGGFIGGDFGGGLKVSDSG